MSEAELDQITARYCEWYRAQREDEENGDPIPAEEA